MTIEPVTGPAVWTAGEIGGKAGLTRELSDAEAEAIVALAKRNADAAPTAIRLEDFRAPAVDALMREVEAEIMAGRGAIVLAHPLLAECDLDRFSRLYWGLGTHLGSAAIQSTAQDLLGRVEKAEVNKAGRGYMMDIELRPHTDFHEILSLACVRKAREGGESGFASSLAIHNILLAERPELMEAMYEGFYHQRASDLVTAEKVPVFCETGGETSCYYHPLFIWTAAKRMGAELPEALQEALKCFTEISLRPEVRAQFVLEPGEMVFWHNFVVLHSREQFHDTPDHKRLLLRLWLHAHRGRPMHPAFNACARDMDAVHLSGADAIDYASTGALADVATR
jgi:hypothetical protein